jgi:ATP synthase protein I
MAEHADRKESSTPNQHLEDEVQRKAERKLRARQEEERTAWFWLGMFGLVGWSIAVPTVIGVALGIWIERRWPGPISWILTLLIIGVGIGCLNAWYWIKQESNHD